MIIQKFHQHMLWPADYFMANHCLDFCFFNIKQENKCSLLCRDLVLLYVHASSLKCWFVINCVTWFVTMKMAVWLIMMTCVLYLFGWRLKTTLAEEGIVTECSWAFPCRPSLLVSRASPYSPRTAITQPRLRNSSNAEGRGWRARLLLFWALNFTTTWTRRYYILFTKQG